MAAGDALVEAQVAGITFVRRYGTVTSSAGS